MVVVTIVGADGVTELLLKLLVVVAVLVILDEIGTEILLLETGGSGMHIPLFVADVDGAIVETGVTITPTPLGGCTIPAVVVVTTGAAMAGVEAIVIRGGGTMFRGC